MFGNGDARRAEFIEPALDVEQIIEERDHLLNELARRESQEARELTMFASAQSS